MEFVEGNYKPTSFLDAILKSSVPDIEKGKSTYSHLKMGLVYKSLVFISDYDLKKKENRLNIRMNRRSNTFQKPSRSGIVLILRYL